MCLFVQGQPGEKGDSAFLPDSCEWVRTEGAAAAAALAWLVGLLSLGPHDDSPRLSIGWGASFPSALQMTCYDKKLRRTGPEQLSSRSDLLPVPPLHSRVNGWSLPLHSFQLITLLLYLYMAVVAFGIYIPLLPHGWTFAAYGVSFLPPLSDPCSSGGRVGPCLLSTQPKNLSHKRQLSLPVAVPLCTLHKQPLLLCFPPPPLPHIFFPAF